MTRDGGAMPALARLGSSGKFEELSIRGQRDLAEGPPSGATDQRSTRSGATTRPLLTAYLILALAFALRAFEVGRQALRGDEAFSVTFVLQPLAAMFRAMATTEPNPPLYWLLLRGWLGLAGRSELAARWPSVLAGVLATALAYRLGRALAGRAVGLSAMLLVAVSPFLIWYGQDARAYSLLTALVVGATWLTWEAAGRRSWTWWAAAGALWWLALFAHYFAALAFAAVGLALLLERWLIAPPATRPRWRPAALMALGVILAYLPWAIYVGPLLAGQSKSWLQPLGFGQALAAILAAASAGPASTGATPALQFAGAILLAVLLIAGTVAGLRHRPSAAIWLLVMGLGPPLTLWLASLARPVFTEQYFISCLPALLGLAAWGVQSVPRRWPAARPLQATGLALWAAIALAASQNSYFNPAFAKSPDWRGLVSYLAQTARPDEVVIVNLPDPAFFLYYHGPMPVETSPPAPLAQAGTAATEAQLARLRDQFQHLRFLFQPSPAYDPDSFVGAWLDACCEKMDDRFVNGFRIQTYDTPSGSLAARQAYRADFAGGPRLTGFRVASAALHAGDALHLTLYWTTTQPITASYTVFVHLLAADGFDLVQADSLPAGGRRTTDQWAPGGDVIDPHILALPADVPPGDYQLEVGLYLLASGQRLGLVGSTGPTVDAVRLPVTITVASP